MVTLGAGCPLLRPLRQQRGGQELAKTGKMIHSHYKVSAVQFGSAVIVVRPMRAKQYNAVQV